MSACAPYFVAVPTRFDTTLSLNSPEAVSPDNCTFRIFALTVPTMPSNVIITLTLTAVKGQASTHIAKLLTRDHVAGRIVQGFEKPVDEIAENGLDYLGHARLPASLQKGAMTVARPRRPSD